MATISGGEKLEAKLKEIAAKLETGATLKVGFLEGATYPDGTPVAAVAFWNEYGHGGRFPAPPRPFFRNMISKEADSWPDKISKALKYTGYDTKRALSMIGEDISGALAQSITELDSPALSETTLMLRKLFGNNPEEIRARDVLAAQQMVRDGEEGATGTQAKPLVWTGHMINSIDFEVNDDGS